MNISDDDDEDDEEDARQYDVTATIAGRLLLSNLGSTKSVIIRPITSSADTGRYVCVSVGLCRNDVTVVCGHDTISMLYGMMSYCGKLTGKHLLCYLNKIESSWFKKSLQLAPDRTVSAAKCLCLHFLALQHGGQNN